MRGSPLLTSIGVAIGGVFVAVMLAAVPASAQQGGSFEPDEPEPEDAAIDERPDLDIDRRRPVSVVAVESAPMVVTEGNRTTGLAVEVWDSVAAEIDVDYELVVVDDATEMFAWLDARRAEVAIVPTAPSERTEVVYDFSTPLLTSGSQIAVVDPPRSAPTLLRAIFSRTVATIALVALGVLLIVSNLIWLVERDRNEAFRSDYHHGIWDAFWWAMVTITTVGYGDKAPATRVGKMIALAWMVFSLFVLSAFIAQVTSLLTREVAAQVVARPADLLTVPVGAVEGSTHEGWLLDRDADVTSVGTVEELWVLLASGQIEAAVTDPFTLAAEEADGDRKIRAVGNLFQPRGESFIVAAESELLEPINLGIHRTRESGALIAITNRWTPD